MNVSKEAQKAETKLKNLDKRAKKAVEWTETKWRNKRREYIGNLPIQVRGMLKAGAVITDDDLEGLDVEFGCDFHKQKSLDEVDSKFAVIVD